MNTDKIVYYESVREFVNSIDIAAVNHSGRTNEWCGGLTFTEAMDKAINGSIEDARRVEPLIEAALSSVDIPTIGRERLPDVCGGVPRVAEFLAGDPDSMWNVRRVESVTAPIRVWYDPTSSASVSSDALLRRGAAVAAFVLALSTIRSVEFWIVTTNGGLKTPAIKLGTSPFVASEIAFAAGHVAFARRLTYGWSDGPQGKWHGQWASWWSGGRSVQSIREALGCDPADVVLGPAFHGDRSIDDPDRWLRETIAQCVTLSE